MMAEGVVAVDLIVDHVGDPGHGVPIGYVKRGQRPFYAVIGKALLYVSIVRYVVSVVIAYKVVAGYLEVGDASNDEHEYKRRVFMPVKQEVNECIGSHMVCLPS